MLKNKYHLLWWLNITFICCKAPTAFRENREWFTAKTPPTSARRVHTRGPAPFAREKDGAALPATAPRHKASSHGGRPEGLQRRGVDGGPQSLPPGGGRVICRRNDTRARDTAASCHSRRPCYRESLTKLPAQKQWHLGDSLNRALCYTAGQRLLWRGLRGLSGFRASGKGCWGWGVTVHAFILEGSVCLSVYGHVCLRMLLFPCVFVRMYVCMRESVYEWLIVSKITYHFLYLPSSTSLYTYLHISHTQAVPFVFLACFPEFVRLFIVRHASVCGGTLSLASSWVSGPPS